MQKRHQNLLSTNHDFLVNEMPMDETLEAMKDKKVLSWHDYEQLKTLRHQGRRALARYFLAVLPHRGPKAFQALLESLQEANAQHLVDLLLQQAGASNMEALLEATDADGDQGDRRTPRTPSDSPLPTGPDLHEYAVKLIRNARYIRKFVDPADISPILKQNKVITPREADMVLHLHGKHKKWDLIMAALLQRGERAYQAFMAALLQKDYSTVFHSIQETSTAPSGSDPDDNDDDSISGKSEDPVDNGAMESDEEIKAETIKSQQQSNIVNEYLRDATSSRTFGGGNDALLQKSEDLKGPNEGISWSANSFRPKESPEPQTNVDGRKSASRSLGNNSRVSLQPQDVKSNHERNSRPASSTATFYNDSNEKNDHSRVQGAESNKRNSLSGTRDTELNDIFRLSRAEDAESGSRKSSMFPDQDTGLDGRNNVSGVNEKRNSIDNGYAGDLDDQSVDKNNGSHENQKRSQRRRSSGIINLNAVQEEAEY